MDNFDELPDVQNQTEGFPKRAVPKVGVENLKALIPALDAQGRKFRALASINSYCSLSSGARGINMSRMARTIFRAIKEKGDRPFVTLEDLARAIQSAHNSKSARVTAAFDSPLAITTPVTKIEAEKFIRVTMTTEVEEKRARNFLEVSSVETSLCPCSKEMSLLKNNITGDERAQIEKLPEALARKILESGFGAHNQKSEVTVTVELREGAEILAGDLHSIIERSCSAPTYPLLKRADEKYVSERAYCGGEWQNGELSRDDDCGPRFVEDIARAAAQKLDALLGVAIADYKVCARSFESIHCDGMNATAEIRAQ